MAVDLDLDALAPPQKTMLLGGREYVVPGDIPARRVADFMRLTARMSGNEEDFSDNAASIDAMTTLVANLLERYNPPMTAEEISEELTVEGMTLIVGLAVGRPGSTLPDAVIETLTDGDQPEAEAVDRDHPTEPEVEQTAPLAETAAA